MKMHELVRRNRSYRRFHQDTEVDRTTLEELVDLARLSASSRNGQALKFYLACDEARNDAIFPHLFWAGYLKDWKGPEEGERPAGYVVVLKDTNLEKDATPDHGIAAQSILLGATERGLGGCIIGMITRKDLAPALGLPPHLEILVVIALGKPKETVVIDEIGEDGDIKYWRDEDGVHHVPKRALQDIILG